MCRQLEDKIIQQRRPASFQVTPDFYGGTDGIRQIIEDFYHQVLEKTPAAERDAVEKLLARGLIRNGRRIMMEASAMRDEYGVPQAALELLHDERLLKREARKGEMYYEISHDTLVKPVLERFKKIEEAELAAEAERLREQAAEDKRRLDEAERLTREAVQGRKRARTFSILAGVVAVVAVLAGFFAWQKQQEAADAKAKADAQLITALEEKQQRLDLEMKDLQRKKQVYGAAENAFLMQETAAKTDSIARLQTENQQLISQLKNN